MYKVGLALLALLFSVFFLPCPFSFFLFLLAYCFSPSSPKSDVLSHLFTMNQLKASFSLVRDLSLLAARIGAVTYSRIPGFQVRIPGCQVQDFRISEARIPGFQVSRFPGFQAPGSRIQGF